MLKTNNGGFGTSPFSKNRFCVSRLKLNDYCGNISIPALSYINSNNIPLGNFNDYLLQIKISNHTSLPTTINFDIYWKEFLGISNSESTAFLIYSGITSTGVYTIPFGNNSGIYSGYCFVYGNFEIRANTNNNFYLNSAYIYQK